MSIAYEINRLQTSKADTKEQVNIDKDYINTGIDFIESETVDDYDEKIQEMQEAYKAFIPVNTTSNTQIDAPKGGTIIGKTLKGNTSQSGTPTPSAPVAVENATGGQKISINKKNLLKTTIWYQTINGVTFVKNVDGTYTATGTASAFINLEIGRFIFSSAKTITYSGAPSDASMSTYSFNLKKIVGSTETWLQDELGTGKTITAEANVVYSARLIIRSGVSVSNIVFKPMVELGSTKTEYEPYQDTTLYMNYNKNLLKINDTSKTINGITFTENSDGSIHAEGTATDLAYYGTRNLLPIIPTQRYRLSGCPEGGSLSSYYISITLKNESGSGIGSFADIGDGVFGDFIAPDSARYMYAEILILSGTTINATFYPQLELGSEITSYKQYEPLQERNYEINLGKNLLEPKMATATYNGITCTNNGDGSFTLNGTATANATFRLDQSTYNGTDNLKHYSGTYTLSCNELQTDMRLIVMQNQTWASLLHLVNTKSTTGTFDKQNCFIYVQVDNGKTVDNLTIRPMLEKSSVATSYSPYFTPIELNKIGDYQDFIRKGIGKNILLGTIETKNTNNVTITKNSGNSCTITTNGTASATTFFYTNEDTLLKANTTYLIGLGNGNNDCQLSIRPSDNSMQYANTTTTSYVTYTPTEDINVRLFVRIANGKSVNETIYPYIQEGTDTPSYEPYACTGKNLFDKNTQLYKSNRYIDGSGQEGTNTEWSIFKTNLEPNTTYTLTNSGASGTPGYVLYNSSGVRVGGSNYSTRRHITFTTTSDTSYMLESVVTDTSSTRYDLNIFQIEQGSIATSYEPYVYSTLKDKWYIEKNVGKVVLDSNCDVESTPASDVYRFAVGVTGIDSIGVDEAGIDSQLYCNSLKPTNRNKTYAKIESMCYGMATNTVYKNFLIYTDETKNYDVATFKTWLGTKKPIVYYIKQNPNYTLIENEELIEQLEKIMPLLEGQNNISVDGSIPVDMDLDYIVRADRYLIGNRREGK